MFTFLFHKSTRDNPKMVGPDESVDLRTVRGKRRKLAKTKGTEAVYHMVKQARSAGIPFDYVLFDTWFSNPARLVDLKEIGADVIAMIKKGSTKYSYKDPEIGNERNLNVKEIYNRNKKRRGRSTPQIIRWMLWFQISSATYRHSGRPSLSITMPLDFFTCV